AALDYWHAGAVPPAARRGPNDPLYHFLVRRLVESWHVPAGVAQYYQWMSLPGADTSFDVAGHQVVINRGLAWRTIQTQWPQIAAHLPPRPPAALRPPPVAPA